MADAADKGEQPRYVRVGARLLAGAAATALLGLGAWALVSSWSSWSMNVIEPSSLHVLLIPDQVNTNRAQLLPDPPSEAPQASTVTPSPTFLPAQVATSSTPTAATAMPVARPELPTLIEIASSRALPVNRDNVVVLIRGRALSPSLVLAAQVTFLNKNANSWVKPQVAAKAKSVVVLNDSLVSVVLPAVQYMPRGAVGSDRYPVPIGDNDRNMGGSALLELSGPDLAAAASFAVVFYVAGGAVTVEQPFGGFPSSCEVADFVKATMFVRSVQAVSNVSECHTRPYILHHLKNTGLGSVVALFTVYKFRVAMRWQATPDVPLVLALEGANSSDTWGYAKQCDKASAWECAFKAYSPCSLDALDPALLVPASFQPLDVVSGQMTPSRSQVDLANPFIDRCGPPGFAAGVVGFITATRGDLEADFAARIKAMGGGPPYYHCIAVHVRLGERGTNIPDYVGPKYMPRNDLDDVLRIVRPMAKAIGTRNVILVSDGSELLRLADEYAGGDVRFHTTRSVPHPQDGNDCMRESIVGCTQNMTMDDIRYAMLLDLEVVSRSCRHFVGTLRSSFTKLAFLRGLGLGVIQHNAISLD